MIHNFIDIFRMMEVVPAVGVYKETFVHSFIPAGLRVNVSASTPFAWHSINWEHPTMLWRRMRGAFAIIIETMKLMGPRPETITFTSCAATSLMTLA